MKRTTLALALCLLLTTPSLAKKRLFAYLPATPSDTAIIVLPGGSYSWLDKKTEGRDVAEALRQRGFAAYVLHYRVQGGFAYASRIRYLIRGHQYPDAQNDLAETIRQVRQHHRVVGVVGFSAGGHLALCAKNVDFIGSIYPVVTLREPYVHKRSRRALLGEWRRHNRTMIDSLSMELHTDRMAAPVFLLNCKDDPIVDYHNSVLLDSALTANRRPHVYYQYPTGGHGFGTTRHNWLDRFIDFFRKIKN